MLVMFIEGLCYCEKVDVDFFKLLGLLMFFEGYRNFCFKVGFILWWMDIILDFVVERGKYDCEVYLLRKYVGDLIIGMFEEKLKGILVFYY